jgi:Domain of unknown function (DUF4136)
MKLAETCWILFFLVITGVSSQGQDVKVEYDKSNDFSGYKTYAYIKGDPAKNPRINQQIIDGIDAQLAARGLHKIDATDKPDLVVVYHAGTEKWTKRNTADLEAYGGGNWSYGWGGTSANPDDRILVGHLIIDIYDVKNKKFIWRGTAKSVISDSPEEVEKTLSKALIQMFEKYPSPPVK